MFRAHTTHQTPFFKVTQKNLKCMAIFGVPMSVILIYITFRCNVNHSLYLTQVTQIITLFNSTHFLLILSTYCVWLITHNRPRISSAIAYKTWKVSAASPWQWGEGEGGKRRSRILLRPDIRVKIHSVHVSNTDKLKSCLTQNTMSLRTKDRPVDSVSGINRCLL